MRFRPLVAPLVAITVAGCAAVPDSPEQPVPPGPPQTKSSGGYYKDDGPHDKPPANLEQIADAVPRSEPLHRFANRPYTVFGTGYVPLAAVQPFRQRGIASWYGRRFHGQKTSSGETYDMYGMTAAHPTLPIPSYARVTRVANGRSVVVRINDRGPFHAGRIIDLSYAAAHKLGFVQSGSAEVELEAVVPDAAQQNAVYVQVGAFSSRENAESFRSRAQRELDWIKESIQVLSIGNLWRLHVGPYRSQDDARPIAERIESQLSLKPLLVVR
jgi:rare lipoprotein A